MSSKPGVYGNAKRGRRLNIKLELRCRQEGIDAYDNNPTGSESELNPYEYGTRESCYWHYGWKSAKADARRKGFWKRQKEKRQKDDAEMAELLKGLKKRRAKAAGMAQKLTQKAKLEKRM